MKLITFTHNGTQKIGAVEDDVVYDFSESSLPKTMVGFIELGEEGIKFAKDIISSKKDAVDLSEVRIEAPIKQPSKILAVGLNYKAHLKEVEGLAKERMGSQPQAQFPNIFNR